MGRPNFGASSKLRHARPIIHRAAPVNWLLGGLKGLHKSRGGGRILQVPILCLPHSPVSFSGKTFFCLPPLTTAQKFWGCPKNAPLGKQPQLRSHQRDFAPSSGEKEVTRRETQIYDMRQFKRSSREVIQTQSEIKKAAEAKK